MNDDRLDDAPPPDEPPDTATNGHVGRQHGWPDRKLRADAVERAIAGAVLVHGHAAIAHLTDAGLDLLDLLDPTAQAVIGCALELHDADEPVDVLTVEDRLGPAATGLAATGSDGHHNTGPAALVALISTASPLGSVAHHARILTRLARERAVGSAIVEATEAFRHGDDRRLAAALERAATAPTATAGRELPAPDIDAFLAATDDDRDWVIPGVLERNDRVLLTGGEGGGKSTFLRQLAVQAAAGIHPFTLDDVPPVRVLLLDLENSERQIRRKIRPLRISAGDRLDTAMLTVSCAPDGLDLLSADDVAALTHLIDTARPDLVLGGPVYKLVGGDPTEEQPAKAAATVLDKLRSRFGFALILETHQPHEAGGGSKRVERPYGASLWKRWPEFGLHIAATEARTNVADLRHWRGARDERDWPAALQRGGEWPWTVAGDRDVTFAFVIQIARDYAFAHGDVPTSREIERRSAELGKRIPKSTVDRMIQNNRTEWEALRAEAAS